MKRILVLISIALILFACGTNKKPVHSFFSPKNIRSQFFSIKPATDNVIRGKHGAFLKIGKGTFDGTEPVIIEIKEIYSPMEIFLSGLNTVSNGKLLESGGMIYVNATRNNQLLQPRIAITVSIPTLSINTKMQLYKGVLQADSSINWIYPIALDTPAAKDIVREHQGLLEETSGLKNTTDSSNCGFDTSYTILNSIDFTFAPITVTSPADEVEPAMNLLALSSPFPVTQNNRYQFTIDKLGWYNIDCLTSETPGISNVMLTASLNFSEKDQLEIKLLFPERRLSAPGSLGDDGKVRFESEDGNVPLFLNDKAVIIAYGKIDGRTFYGISSFIVAPSQNIELNIKETTLDYLEYSFKEMKLDGIDLDAINKKRIITPIDCNKKATTDTTRH